MDWKRKLTSRKLWAAIVSFAALLVVALGGSEAQATQITALIMAGATVVAYIVGEGLVDAASAGASMTINGNTTVQGVDGPQGTGNGSDVKSTVQTETTPTTAAEAESGAVASDTTGAK